MQTGQESTTLFLAKSDNEFTVRLAPQGQGWLVWSERGRRGGKVKLEMHMAKTLGQVTYRNAKEIYDDLVAVKIAQGYTATVHHQGEKAPVAQAAPAVIQVATAPEARQAWSIRGA